MTVYERGRLGGEPIVVEVAELGRTLRARRVEVGLSQEAVCRSAGVARSWLSKVEAGRHGGAELQKVLDLAAVLGLSLTLTHHETVLSEPGPTRRAVESSGKPRRRRPPPSAPVPAPAPGTRSARMTEGDPFEHLLG